MNSIEYTEFLNDLSNEIVFRQQQDDQIPVEAVMAQLLPGHPDNSRIRTLAMRLGVTTGARWDREEKRATASTARDAKIIAALGAVPTSIREFISLSAAHYGWQVRYRGEIIQPDGEWINAVEIGTRLILDGDELGLAFKDAKIVRGVDEWIAAEKRARFEIVRTSVTTLADPARREAVLSCLTAACRLYFSTDAEYAAAAICKFIWQVKRKMGNLDIAFVHMLILTGDQGCGKSNLVDAICSPVSELSANVAFDELSDNRNISLWNNYVLNADELVRAGGADTTAIKNVITSTRAERRILGTNSMASVRMRASIIGTSNRPVGEVIIDPTGMRRFIELLVIPRGESIVENWQRMIDLDWLAIWQAVDEHAEDPITGVRAAVEEAQEEMRARLPVEEFLDHWETVPNGSLNWRRNPTNEYDSTHLFEIFSEWERINYPGGNRVLTTHAKFGRQMASEVAGGKWVGWSARMRGKQRLFSFVPQRAEREE